MTTTTSEQKSAQMQLAEGDPFVWALLGQLRKSEPGLFGDWVLGKVTLDEAFDLSDRPHAAKPTVTADWEALTLTFDEGCTPALVQELREQGFDVVTGPKLVT